MSDDLSSLGEEELGRLLQLMESLERSPFDFLQLEVGGLKVVLGKGSPDRHAHRLGDPATLPDAGSGAADADLPAADPSATASSATDPPATAGTESAPLLTDEPEHPGVTVEIRAPMMGIFYAQPEPGAPPYVSVGSKVQPDTTVALIEVMKMFNAVRAGVEGTVAAVLVENSQLVEYGQPLFRVCPS